MHLDTVDQDTSNFGVLPLQVAMGQSFSEAEEKVNS